MSRLPPALARRIDRLARRAHAFHRWAHHPLCSRYAEEVIPLGRRTRVCLGCALTLAGTVAGTALGLRAPAPPEAGALAGAALLAAAVPAIVSRSSARARPRSRVRKLLTRLLPAGAAGLLIGEALGAPSPARGGAAAVAAVAVGWVIVRYRRRGPDRSACRECPDAPPGSRCPGLAPIARRERALARLAGRWIGAALPVRPEGDRSASFPPGP